MARHRMPFGDAAWLHMDRPTNHMIVNSVMWFDEPLHWDTVRTLLKERMLDRYPRFQQKVVEQRGGVWFEDDDGFDLDRHIQHVTLPAPGRRADLEQFVSSTLDKALPRDRPLWEVYFIDGYNGGGSALLARTHHCVADGVALMRVMMGLTDDPAEAALANIGDLDGGGRGLIGSAAHIAGQIVGTVAGGAVHPSRLIDLFRDVSASGDALVRLLAMLPDNSTALKGSIGRTKHVTWTDPISLRSVRDAAHAGQVTINDLLLAAVTGALRSYLVAADGHAADIRAIMPVNLRPLDQPLPADLGNRFGLVFLSLPVSVDDRRERLDELSRRSAALKHSAQGTVVFEVLDLIGHLPYVATQPIVDIFASKGTAVMTNVPGPRGPIFLAGRKVRGTIGWPPESGSLSLGVSIISYDGEIVIGLMTDNRLITEPEALLERVRAEVAALLDLLAAPVALAAPQS